MHRCAILTLVLIVLAAPARAENWPAWRGPRADGTSAEKDLPVRWSATENIAWKVPLQSPGNSTPIVWGDHIYMTAATEEGARRSLLCLARSTGKTLWTRTLAAEPKELTHGTNPHCASSPVTDGERIVVWHGSAGAAAYDTHGKELWRKDLGKFTHIWGYASSPVIVDDRVVFLCGPGLRSFAVALDKRSGKELWRRELPSAQSKKPDEFLGSWSTPVVRSGKNGAEILLSLPHELLAVDAKTGKDVWKCKGLGPLSYTSPLVTTDGETAVVMGGYHGPAFACRAGGTGDVTDSRRLWLHETKNPQRVGSGVIVGEHIYILNEPGIFWCIHLRTGDVSWKQRITGQTWSSTCYADGRLYLLNMEGETLVIKPNPEKFELIASNKLDNETTRASLVFSDGQIFVRSYKHLYCIGKR